jgi:hypothetical protein
MLCMEAIARGRSAPGPPAILGVPIARIDAMAVGEMLRTCATDGVPMLCMEAIAVGSTV